ncbi:MAG: DUF4118 domain-containing protein, partial [Chlamydiales bacterium]
MPWLEYRGIGVIFLLNILFLSLTVGQGPILLSALLSSLFWDLLFVPPVLSLTIHRAEDAELLLIYFLIASVMGFLSSRVKEKERLLSIREENSE